MRAGGGKEKGSSFEREVGKRLSLWLTRGEKPDLFSRNVLSGGSFTLAEKGGRVSSRMPGDLMAASPLAFNFLTHFSVECKHLADIKLDAYIWDHAGGTMLGEIIALAKRQAQTIKCEFMVVAKQNRRDPLILVNGEIGPRFLAAKRTGKRAFRTPMYHYLHRQSIFVMRLDDLCLTIDPGKLLEG